RAQAVFAYLTGPTHTIAPGRLTRVGYGESQLVVDTHDSMNNSVAGTSELANRRVELTLDRRVYTGSGNAFQDGFNGGLGLDGAGARTGSATATCSTSRRSGWTGAGRGRATYR